MATNPQPPHSSRKNRLSTYGRLSGLGIQMLVLIFAGMYGGVRLDESLHLKVPVFTIILSLSGVAVAIWIAVKDSTPKK